MGLELQEWTSEDGELIPWENGVQLSPQEGLTKIVVLKNTGEEDLNVEVQVECRVELKTGGSGEPEYLLLNIDEENWEQESSVKSNNGALLRSRYVYSSVLHPGETTTPLFTTVTLDQNADPAYSYAECTIRVKGYGTAADWENAVLTGDVFPALWLWLLLTALVLVHASVRWYNNLRKEAEQEAEDDRSRSAEKS